MDNDNSTFQIEPQNGELPGMGRTMVRVTFAPKVPMNYYRKVACLVHHKVGRVFNLLVKPGSTFVVRGVNHSGVILDKKVIRVVTKFYPGRMDC